jgi:hypothetical protein
MDTIARLWENAQNINGIAGTIAIFITVTVCLIGLVQCRMQKDQREIPDILKVTLAAIIGFYFGISVKPKEVATQSKAQVTFQQNR